jgi:hypothetical protein
MIYSMFLGFATLAQLHPHVALHEQASSQHMLLFSYDALANLDAFSMTLVELAVDLCMELL